MSGCEFFVAKKTTSMLAPVVVVPDVGRGFEEGGVFARDRAGANVQSFGCGPEGSNSPPEHSKQEFHIPCPPPVVPPPPPEENFIWRRSRRRKIWPVFQRNFFGPPCCTPPVVPPPRVFWPKWGVQQGTWDIGHDFWVPRVCFKVCLYGALLFGHVQLFSFTFHILPQAFHALALKF